MDAPVSSRKTTLLFALVIFAAAFLGMSRICGHEFVDWDDAHTLYSNPYMNPASSQTLKFYWTHGEYGLYVPVTYTVWCALAAIARFSQPDLRGIWLNPHVFHTASVFVHALAALAMFALLRRLLERLSDNRNTIDLSAAIGALVFALHPVQVESVAWASGLKDVLCGTFSLVALWQYVCAVESPTRRRAIIHYTIATITFILAILSKPSAMVVPALVAVIHFVLLEGNWKTVAKWTALWWPISLAGMVVARIVQFGHDQAATPIWTRPLIATDALAFYVAKILWPIKLCIDYGRTPTFAIAHHYIWWTWLVPFTIAVLLYFRPRRALISAALLACICVAPVLGLTPFLFQFYSTVSDHYLYLAMLGPALAAAWVAANYPIARTAALVMIALFAIRSVTQAAHWTDDEAVFVHTVAVNPDSFVAYNNLASAYSRVGDVMTSAAAVADRVDDRATAADYREQARRNYARAKDLFTISINKRIAVNGTDDYLTARGNLAMVCSRLGQYKESLAQFKAAEAIVHRFFPGQAKQNLPDIYSLEGQDLLALDRPKDAIKYFDEALRIQPHHPQAAAAREKALNMMAGTSMEMRE